jgi:hypothetical protein
MLCCLVKPFFQAYRDWVKDFVFYDQTAFLLEKV